MKIGVIVETVYQRVSGGKPSTDSKIKRIDIKAYLPASINEVVKEELLLSFQTNKAVGGIPTQFFATYEDVEIKWNIARQVNYSELPITPVMLPKSSGVNMVSSMNGEVVFTPILRNDELAGYEKYVGNTLYWLEGKYIFYKNLSPFVKSVLVRCLASADEMNDDDEAPIPSGYEAKVIDRCVQHFLGTKQVPHDDIVDNTENRIG